MNLPPPLAQILLDGKGKRSGEANIFNEYVYNYEHAWEIAEDVPFASPPFKVLQQVIQRGPSTLYDKDVPWAQLQHGR